MKGMAAPGAVINICTWPLTTAMVESPAPLYGICAMSILDMYFISSIDRWPPVPAPEEA